MEICPIIHGEDYLVQSHLEGKQLIISSMLKAMKVIAANA